uniref:Uncharacterized protein n=1 Tax=Anopheles culicifacies TaxID=139723 RepID=A0A182MJN6_9DIPT
MLRPDKVSCKAIGKPQYVLYTKYDQIRKLTVHPSQIETLLQANDSRISTMDMDIRQQKLYFAAENRSALYELNLQTDATRVMTSVGTPDKVTVDWITANVYFVDIGEHQRCA